MLLVFCVPMAVWRIIIIYSSAVWSFVLQKNQVTRLPINWEDEIALFIDYAKGSSFRRSALKLSLPAVVYSICCERNTRIFQHKFLDPDSLCAKIFNSIRDAMVSWRDVKTKQMYIKSNKLAKAETVQRKVLHIMELSKIGAGFLLLLCYVLCPGLHLLTGKIVLKEQEIAYKGFSSVDAALKSYSFLVMMLLLLLLLVLLVHIASPGSNYLLVLLSFGCGYLLRYKVLPLQMMKDSKP